MVKADPGRQKIGKKLHRVVREIQAGKACLEVIEYTSTIARTSPQQAGREQLLQ